MSLDVFLHTPPNRPRRLTGSRRAIFVRENGRTAEISREEWDARHPGVEPATCEVPEGGPEIYRDNVTHNLSRMAEAAGLYGVLWRPDEHGLDVAAKLVAPLRRGLVDLCADREKYEAYNPENGWGSWEVLVGFVARYLRACEAHPDATVSVWR